jgi:hypothetical protein
MSKKKTPVTFTIVAPIPAEDLVDSILSSMTFEQIHAFIVKLDKGCEDWGVTEKLFKYFQKEMKKMAGYRNGPARRVAYSHEERDADVGRRRKENGRRKGDKCRVLAFRGLDGIPSQSAICPRAEAHSLDAPSGRRR